MLPAHVDKRSEYNTTVGQGETTGGWTINPPVTQQQEAEQQKDINYTYTVLGGIFVNGTHSFHVIQSWNFVNKTDNGTVVAKGTITIGEPTGDQEIVNNKIIWQGGFSIDPVIPGNSSLIHIVEMIGANEQYGYHPVLYTIKVLNPNHVLLTHGLILNDINRVAGVQNNTIDLTSNDNTTATTVTSNEDSYMFGYNIGKIDGTTEYCIPQNGVTNGTACTDGYFSGYKNWCINHARDCVENFITGDFPEMILKAHQQYLLGNKSATGNSMCPIGENTAFCDGWENNNDDYGGQDCSDSPLANISYSLMGCAQDIMTVSQIGGAELHTLVGTWDYVNESKGSETMTGTGISGKIEHNL